MIHERSPAIGGVCLDARDPSPERLTGTAFAISTTQLLTAFHCVGDRGSGQVTTPQLSVWLPDQFITAKVVDTLPDKDVAILELDSALPDQYEPLQLAHDVPAGIEFTVAGWPEGRPFPSHLLTVHGKVVNPQALIFDAVPALQLHCVEAQSLSLHGYSGAPVLIRGTEGRWVAAGVVRWNPPQADAPDYAKGGIVFATPLSALAPHLALESASSELLAVNDRSRGLCICYAKLDLEIARWIGSVFEEQGFVVKARYNYLRPGLNYVQAIAEAHATYPDVMIVLSETTLTCDSPSHQAELRRLEAGHPGQLIPVRVEPVDLPRFVASLEPLDLYDFASEQEKREQLLNAFTPAAAPPAHNYPYERFDIARAKALSRSRLPRVTLQATGMIEGEL